jgi:threonine/homoserine/homoserine lactone efflux protein
VTDTERLTAFLLAGLVIVVIPGPSVLFVVGRALAHGRATALASVVGNAIGSVLVLVLVSLGLGRLVQASDAAFTALKIVGACYLVYLGVQAIRHRRDLDVTPGDLSALPAPTRAAVAIRQGVVVGVTNPKVYVMFAALLPQFVDPTGSVPAQMLGFGGLLIAIGLVTDGLWATGAATLRSMLVRTPRRSRTVVAAGGVSMIGLGAWLALEGRD